MQMKAQLSERPPLEVVQGLQKEYTNLEILLQGTQRENERCMSELERYFFSLSICVNYH